MILPEPIVQEAVVGRQVAEVTIFNETPLGLHDLLFQETRSQLSLKRSIISWTSARSSSIYR
jgi:hypothetical protein